MISLSEREFFGSEYDAFFAVWNNEDVQSAANQTEQAYILTTKYHIPPVQLIKLQLTSYHSLSRAKEAASLGYDIGVNGRHNKLCKQDRIELKQTVIQALQEREHIYPSTLVNMVCSIPFLHLHLIKLGKFYYQQI